MVSAKGSFVKLKYMNLILTVTDNGSSATKAVAYASHLAKRAKADILIATLTNLAGNMVCIDNADEEFITGADEHDPQQHDIKYIVVSGNVYYGASGLMVDPKFEQLLLKANAPVIIVSEDVPVRYTEKFIFLTDITADDHSQLDLLCKLAGLSAGSVMLTQPNAPRPLDGMQQSAWNAIMRGKIHTVDYGRIYYYNIPDNIDKPDMEYIVKDCRAEALAVVYPKNGLIDNNTLVCGFKNALIGSLKIPLIVFPSSMAIHKN